MITRIILNGKKAALEPVRNAIFAARSNSPVEVRVTWEKGDVRRLVQEACEEGCSRLVVGGGDGTVKEIVDAFMRFQAQDRPELAILPLGTANDFATACGVPNDPLSALTLAQRGKAFAVDCIQANEEYFINVASGGFGAQVTANTPVELKNFLGGGAYTLSGLIQAIKFNPYHGELRTPDGVLASRAIVGAACNGRQAGGGQQLAPEALIDDGLMDIIALLDFPKERLMQVIMEVQNPASNGEYVKRYRVPWAEWESDVEIPTNLDGEPVAVKRMRFEVVPAAIK
ncbi:MAG: lipid kinase YegS, partial [Desulfuromonadales bacterium]|nr:lipid kinase YegS [Desulfuromonadales bacterium]